MEGLKAGSSLKGSLKASLLSQRKEKEAGGQRMKGLEWGGREGKLSLIARHLNRAGEGME